MDQNISEVISNALRIGYYGTSECAYKAIPKDTFWNTRSSLKFVSISTAVEPSLIYKLDFLKRSGVPASGPAQSVKNLRSVDGGATLK